MKTDETKDQDTGLPTPDTGVLEHGDDFDFSYIPSFETDAPVVLFDEVELPEQDADADEVAAQIFDECEAEAETVTDEDDGVALADESQDAQTTEECTEVEACDETATDDDALPNEPTLTKEDIREALDDALERTSDENTTPKAPEQDEDLREEPVFPVEDGVRTDEPTLCLEDIVPADEDDAQITFFDGGEAAANEDAPKDSQKDVTVVERPMDARFDFLELCIFTLVIVLVITTFFFRHSIVDGASMEQTLYDGDRLILSSFLYTPEVGDIIVCEDYSTALRKPIVKRVIATAGQTVEIYDGRTVYVDGVLVDDSYVYIDRPDNTPYLKHTVAEGHIFVMGDHRNASTDSRDIGDVSLDSVIGKVVMRIYPFDTITFFP